MAKQVGNRGGQVHYRSQSDQTDMMQGIKVHALRRSLLRLPFENRRCSVNIGHVTSTKPEAGEQGDTSVHRKAKHSSWGRFLVKSFFSQTEKRVRPSFAEALKQMHHQMVSPGLQKGGERDDHEEPPPAVCSCRRGSIVDYKYCSTHGGQNGTSPLLHSSVDTNGSNPRSRRKEQQRNKYRSLLRAEEARQRSMLPWYYGQKSPTHSSWSDSDDFVDKYPLEEDGDRLSTRSNGGGSGSLVSFAGSTENREDESHLSCQNSCNRGSSPEQTFATLQAGSDTSVNLVDIYFIRQSGAGMARRRQSPLVYPTASSGCVDAPWRQCQSPGRSQFDSGQEITCSPVATSAKHSPSRWQITPVGPEPAPTERCADFASPLSLFSKQSPSRDFCSSADQDSHNEGASEQNPIEVLQSTSAYPSPELMADEPTDLEEAKSGDHDGMLPSGDHERTDPDVKHMDSGDEKELACHVEAFLSSLDESPSEDALFGPPNITIVDSCRIDSSDKGSACYYAERQAGHLSGNTHCTGSKGSLGVVDQFQTARNTAEEEEQEVCILEFQANLLETELEVSDSTAANKTVAICRDNAFSSFQHEDKWHIAEVNPGGASTSSPLGDTMLEEAYLAELAEGEAAQSSLEAIILNFLSAGADSMPTGNAQWDKPNSTDSGESGDQLENLEFDFVDEIDGMERDLAYVCEILTFSGFVHEGSDSNPQLPSWHSPSLPLCPTLFDELEAQSSSLADSAEQQAQRSLEQSDPAGANDRTEGSPESVNLVATGQQDRLKCQRRLLFDAVNEALAIELGSFQTLLPWLRPPRHPICRQPTGSHLLQKVWARIHAWAAPAGRMAGRQSMYQCVDTICFRDMEATASSRGAWTFHGEEIGCLTQEIEEYVLNLLLEDIILEYSSVGAPYC